MTRRLPAAALTFAALALAVPVAHAQPDGWTLVWQDEFNGTILDTTKWRAEDAFLIKNNELQYYTPDDVYVENGELVLRSQNRFWPNAPHPYTSGLVETRDRFEFTYGRVDVRAILPGTQGMWPAHWSLPADGGWPPEIDYMELLGHQPNTVHMTNHWGTWPNVPNNSADYTGPDFTNSYNVFRCDWLPGQIDWYINGVRRHTSTSAVPDEPFYIILNTAVGGNWPGNPDASTVFPQYHRIDYVRYYRKVQPSNLTNGSFEAFGMGTPFNGWSAAENTIGNISLQTALPDDAESHAKIFGRFAAGAPSEPRLWQDRDAGPDETWTARASVAHESGDALEGAVTAFIRLEFLDGQGTVLAQFEETILESSSPTDAYTEHTVSGDSPVGTTTARIVLGLVQPATGPRGGAAYFDTADLFEDFVNELSNPGFELDGGPRTFQGWSNLGDNGTNIQQATAMPAQGAHHASIAGRGVANTAGESGVRQDTTAQPDEYWTASVDATHPTGDPLVGGSEGVLRMEFIDSSNTLLDAVETTIASSVTPTGAYQRHEIGMTAPAGTDKARLLVLHREPASDRGGILYADRAVLAPGTQPQTPACPGDLNTTGTTNGVPDGTTNLSDLQFFLTTYQNDLGITPGSVADVNTTGTTNGTPDGTVNLSDLQFFLTLWAQGTQDCS